jgi:hypothetical protein
LRPSGFDSRGAAENVPKSFIYLIISMLSPNNYASDAPLFT